MKDCARCGDSPFVLVAVDGADPVPLCRGCYDEEVEAGRETVV